MKRGKNTAESHGGKGGAVDYNMEDTGRLMTMSSRGSRTRKIVLTAVSVLLVAAVAAGGFFLIREKQYNDHVAIAEKAFAEGDYELAEAEYLKAADISKRKPKAREGLAYTYAIQGRSEESAEVYLGLFRELKDKKYKLAAEEVTGGGMPSDRTIVPALGLWRNASVSDIPYEEDFKEYLWGLYYSYFYLDGSVEYDCNDPSGFPALHLLMEFPYEFGNSIEARAEDIYPEWIGEMIDGDDPRGWISEYHEDDMFDYSSCDTGEADLLAKEVFNVTDEVLAEDLSYGESEHDLYEEDGRYYIILFGGGGALDLALEYGELWTDGEKFCLKYDAGWADFEDEDWETIDRTEEYCTAYILFEPKLIDGEHYWSLYYNGSAMPAEVEEGLRQTYGETPGQGGDEGKRKSSEEAYQPVIDEYREMLAAVDEGTEYEIYADDQTNGFTYVFSEMVPDELNEYRQPLYAFADINDDGVDEMIVGAEYDGESYFGSILALDESGEPQEVIDCVSFMYRADLDIYDDGTIMYGGSSGAETSAFTFYELEGTELIETDAFRADGGYFTLNEEEMNEDDFYYELDNAMARDSLAVEWRSF